MTKAITDEDRSKEFKVEWQLDEQKNLHIKIYRFTHCEGSPEHMWHYYVLCREEVLKIDGILEWSAIKYLWGYFIIRNGEIIIKRTYLELKEHKVITIELLDEVIKAIMHLLKEVLENENRKSMD